MWWPLFWTLQFCFPCKVSTVKLLCGHPVCSASGLFGPVVFSVGKHAPVSSLFLSLCVLQKGTYLPQTYIIHEEMVVTGKVHNMRQLGPFIYRLCNGKDTYRLNRRVTHRRKLGLKEGSVEILKSSLDTLQMLIQSVFLLKG